MAIQSLFGPSAADIQEQRRRLAEQEIAASGGEFGVFAPLYRAGSRFGRQAAEGINTLLGAQDPMLKKATDIQSVLSKYEGQDLTKASTLSNISRELAGLGYANEAFGLAQEANKIARLERAEAREVSAETRREQELDLRRRQVVLEEVNKDPYGSIAKALLMPEDSPERQVILAGASARIGEKNFDQAVKEAQIRASEASAAASRAQVERAAGGEVSENLVTEAGEPLTRRGGKLYKMDGKVYEGKVKRLAAPSPYASLLEGGGAATPAKPGQPRLSDEEVRRLLRGAARVPEVGGSTWDMGQ